MEKFLFGILSILTTNLFQHWLALGYAVLSGLLLYHAVHTD